MAGSRTRRASLVDTRPGAGRSFAGIRTYFDTFALTLLREKTLRRAVKSQSKTNLSLVWAAVVDWIRKSAGTRYQALEPLQIHEVIVEGLPGEALFVSSAMAFDSVPEALRLFDLSTKTARQRIGGRLTAGESEIALRLARVFTMAARVFGDLQAAREYFQTPNFALGGAAPRDLLQTAEGEQIVLAELHAQAEGLPV